MAEYIGREEALAFPFANGHYDSKNAISIFILGCESYREYLESIPAADVRPVMYGEWIWEEPNSSNRFRGCFLCNKCFESVYAKKNYCPNCGADMRGEEDDKM